MQCPFHGLVVPRDDSGRPVDNISSLLHGASSSLEYEAMWQHTDTSAHVHDATSLPGLKLGKKRKRREFFKHRMTVYMCIVITALFCSNSK